MLDLSRVKTVGVGKYILDSIDIPTFDESIRKFLTCVQLHKQVIYDWGYHVFFACQVAFLVDYDKKVILKKDGNDLIDNDQWVSCDPEKFHESLVQLQTFEGEWGPTATDTILRMENSGIKVDICGTKNFGPENPKEFLESLRQIIAHQA
jgi:hypothetical protein